MSWSVLQSNSVTKTTTATTWSLAYTGNVSSGTVLLVAVGQSGAGTISSVKDGANNSFTQIGVVNLGNSNTHGECALYAITTPSGDVGTAPTITVTFSSSVVGSLWVGEVSGIQAVTDGTAATAFGSTGACTPTYSDTAASEFFITVFADDGGPETSSVTGGWTSDSKSINNNADANIVVAYGNSVNGTETNAWTSTGSTTFCGAVAVSFKLTASGPTIAQPLVVAAPYRLPPALLAIVPQLLPGLGNLAYAFTDSGSGSDALTVSTPLSDTGTGSDSLTVTPWIPQPFTVRLAPPPVPVIPPQLMPLPPVTAISLTDSGTGSDALSVSVPLADSGAGSDTLSVLSAAQPVIIAAPYRAPAPPPAIPPQLAALPPLMSLTDSGAGSDALAVTVAFTDTGTAADALAITVTGSPGALIVTPAQPVPAAPPLLSRLAPLFIASSNVSLPDSGAGTDTAAIAITLTDGGSGADTLSVFPGNPLTLTPAQPQPAAPPIPPRIVLSLATPVSLSDAGTGSDTLSITVPLADSGAAADTSAVALSVTDTGSGTDAMAAAFSMTDTGTGADTSAVAFVLADPATATDSAVIALTLAEAGSGADTLTLTSITITLAETGTGTDTVVIAVAVVDHANGADVLSIPPAGNTGTARWSVGAYVPRWAAKPANPRWRAVLVANFTPIAAISLQEINVVWTSDLAGTVIDPTVAPLVVQMAFPISSGNINAPAQPVTWYNASWLPGAAIRGYIAQCLVGPGGGVVNLSAGQSYDVWSKISGSPEIPAMFAGVQAVY